MNSDKKIESQISVPNGVKIERKEQFLIFSGVLGFTKLNLAKIDPMGLGGIRLSQDEKILFIFGQSKPFFHSLKRVLINKIRGVTVGFRVSLRIVGVGYRASLEKNKSSEKIEKRLTKNRSTNLLLPKKERKEKHVLNFKLGYSHNLKYVVPDSIRAFLLEPTLLCLFGIDKNQVSQIASKIRNFKVPERYKGKGIRFTTERVILSQGKRK